MDLQQAVFVTQGSSCRSETCNLKFLRVSMKICMYSMRMWTFLLMFKSPNDSSLKIWAKK